MLFIQKMSLKWPSPDTCQHNQYLRAATEELHKTDLHTQITTMVWALTQSQTSWSVKSSGSITMSKASGGDGIPVELFQILKNDAVKVLHSTCQQIWKTQQWPQDWKRSVFIPIPAIECSNYHTIALISHASKVMLNILQARLHQYVNCELPDVQAGFRKGRGTRDQIAKFLWIIKKARQFQNPNSPARGHPFQAPALTTGPLGRSAN